MCTLAIYWHVSPDLPLVIAANRDEFLARSTAEPRVLCHDPWVFAGQDLEAGGTWLGVNEHRLVVGLLNRPGPEGPDPARRSRGLLCLEALQSASPRDVVETISAEEARSYNGFNLLAANEHDAFVISNDGRRIHSMPLTAGVHVLTNMDLNDPRCPRIAQSHQLFRQVSLPESEESPADFLAQLRQILSNHEVTLDPRAPVRSNTLCVHLGEYGTRSSSVILVPAGGRSVHFWHAPGPPCQAEYRKLDLPPSSSTGEPTSL